MKTKFKMPNLKIKIMEFLNFELLILNFEISRSELFVLSFPQFLSGNPEKKGLDSPVKPENDNHWNGVRCE